MQSINGGRFYLVYRSSEVSEYQDRELLNILHIQGVSEGGGNIGVAIPCEFLAFCTARVNLHVAGRALLALMEHFQRA